MLDEENELLEKLTDAELQLELELENELLLKLTDVELSLELLKLELENEELVEE